MTKGRRAKPMKPFLCGFCKGRFFSLASTEEHVRVQHPRRAQVDVFERVSSVVNEQPPELEEVVF
jgi:hypothetical protein